MSYKKDHFRPASSALALEPRLMFDGAAAVAAVEYFDNHQDFQAEAQRQETQSVAEATPDSPAPGVPGVLLIIDARVADHQSLLAGLPANVTVRVIHGEESGIAAVSEELAKGDDFAAIHIISHGSSGSLGLGSDQISAGNLAAQGQALQAWASHLTAEADILLYGCDIAGGEAGQVFITELAHLTGADIAASTDATGAATKGGDWVLESRTGAIESSLAISQATLAAYGELLAATSITDSNAATPRATAEDSPLAITGLSVAGGASDTITLTIATTGGAAKLGTTSGLTVSGDNTAAITVTGTIANINSALAGLTYQPTVDQNSSTAGFTPSIALNVTSGGAGSLTVGNLSVTAVNDAPSLATKTPLAVNEGGSASFALQALASSANALDVDIATGQQVIGQQMVIINSLPAKGTLSYMGGAVAVGQVVPVSSLGSLRYTHNGSDLAAPDADSFNVTVSDGGGAQTPGSINVTINPANKAPAISGSPSLIEGQVKGVAPTIDLGDMGDSASEIEFTAVNNGGQGTLFIDLDSDGVVDAGEAVSAGTKLTGAAAANIDKLKFRQDGTEPNAPAGVSSPSYTIKVTDSGGGTATPLDSNATITIKVQPNNDDPTLTNAHTSTGSALGVAEGAATSIASGMLAIADADRNPANTAQTTPADQLVYTIETVPLQGEVQLNIGADGWITLGVGGRFTQADVDAGRVRFVQTSAVANGATVADSFQFTVRDSAFGYDVWNDPTGNPPPSNREGGVRSDPKDAVLATQTFHVLVTGNNAAHTVYEGDPRPAWPGYGTTADLTLNYSFTPKVASPGNTQDASQGAWQEDNVVTPTASGNLITKAMLEYEIVRTAKDAGGATVATIVLPPTETVYTLTVQPPNGVVQRLVGASWEAIPTNGQFTQQDINDSKIRFVHDGSEDHAASFSYIVSDGTPNNAGGSFAIDVAPTNDRPTSSGSGSAQVQEGNGNSVRLGTSHLGMGDIDGSLDGKTGEGAADFLWFQIAAQPVDGGPTPRGTLERWNGTAWVAVTPGEWLPSTLLAATADGGTSGLRYRHDGSEPLAYTGGPKVAFSYTVRDDLTNPADPFATSIAAPADASGSAQSNVSGPATVTINITPVNDAPQVADKPGDADPAILETIAGGGATAGVNNILSGVLEGSTSTITNAYLAAVDRDNTTTQRQFRITQAPGQGTLLLNGAAIGVGSTFTQADIDAGKVAYRHNGSEINAQTTDGLGSYNDKFHFVVNDGVLEDSGAGADNNVFLITLAPTNDKPTVTGPTGTIDIDSATAGNNPVSGFSVGDPDWTNPATSTDFVQVTVRLQSSGGTPITNYTTGFAGGGVQVGYGAGSGVVVTQDGNNNILQFQGTKAQVNAALAGLAVTFANDADALYKLEVIVDDRMRDGSGALVTTAADANGGELNQPATPGGTTTLVDATAYDWKTAATVPAASGNIASTTVDLRASSVNQPPVFSGPPSFTVNEDVRSPVGDGTANKFVVEDAESTAFGTPVTVTVSVPSGTLHIGPTGTPGSLTPAGGLAVAIGGQGTGSITLTGRADDIQAVLNGRNVADNANDGSTGLHYTSASNVNHDQNGGDAGDVTLTLNFSEGASAIGSDVGSGSVANAVAPIATALTITAINDAPTVATGAGAIAIAGTGATAVPGFVVNDVDATDGYVLGESDGTIQATVRVLNQAGAPLLQADYVALGIALDTTALGHGATVDATLNGSTQALELRGTRDQINAYLAGLQVTFASLGSSNLDALYKVEVVADDRLRDGGTGSLTSGANGGANNQQTGLPAVPATDTFDSYGTTVSVYGVYNVTSSTRDLFISSINDPGKITASNVTVSEGSATLDLTSANANIVLDDSDDNGASTMEVTVTVGAGTITAVGGVGGTVAGLNTNTITIAGATEAQINARLKALTVTFPDVVGDAAPADWNGSFDVTITYNDKGNTGTRPGTLAGDTNDARTGNGDYGYADGASNHLVTTRTITVTVNGVNDAPTRTVATVTLPAGTEDTDGGAGDAVNNLFGATFSDAKDQIGGGGSAANSFAGIAITGNNAIAAQGQWQYSIDGGTTWIALPVVSASNALLLDTTAKLRFDPADNFHGTPGGLVTRLVDNSSGAVTSATTADVSGANSGGTTRYSDNSNAVTLTTTVANVNDRPTATNGGVTATEDQKDASAGAGTPVSALGTDLGYSDVSDNQTAISGGGNAASAFGGIAIVGDTTSAGGSWQYSTDGTTWTDVPAGVSDTNALVLPTTASVRFNPTTADFNGTPTGGLQVRAADTVQTFASGSTLTVGATSTWSDVVTLGATVAPRNDAPGFTHAPTSPTVTENATTGSGTSINAVKLLGSGAVTDIDLGTTSALSSTVFGAGSVTVTLADGITGDVLQLDGLAAGANGIATIAGGSGSTALVVTFTNAATVAQVEAVLAAIEYTNTSDDPTNRLSGTPQTQRNYTVVLSDGNNVQSGGNAGGPAPLAATKNGTITINATNDPPLATPNTNAVTEDSGTPVTGNVKTDGTADSDPDNALVDVPVTAIVATTAGGASTPVADNAGAGTVVAGKYGTLTIHPNGSYSYALDNSNPDVNALNDTETLNEVFNYTITDPGSLSANSTLTITINGHTDGAPQIVPVDGNAGATGQATVHEKGLTSAGDTTETTTGTITVTAPDGVAKVTIGGQVFTVAQLDALSPGSPSAVIDTGEGQLRITGIGNKTGAPGAPVSADVSYTYTLKVQQDQPGATESSDTIALVVTDNSATPKSANGNLVIQIMDDMPTATNDASSITRGSATVLGNAFTNDRIGADGPQAVGAPVTGITGGSLGTPLNGTYGAITLNANGTYSYALDNSNPAVAALLDGQKLTETFTYTITDKDGDTSTATLTITVNGLTPNALPVAVNDDFTLPEDQVLTGTLTGNDVPSADGGNVWAKATDPQHGKVVVGPDGRFVYVPDPDYHGPDSFTYTITDVNGDQSTATVTLTVLPVDDVPVAVADSAVTGKDKPVSGSLSGNDKPSGDGGNVWTKTTDPANGTVVVNPDGSYTYTPRPGFAGEDRFTYTVTDKDGDTSTATVTVTVVPNDVPVAVADRVSTAIDKPVSGSLSGNDKPSADGGNVWAKTTDPANGTVVVNPDGSYTYTPRPGFAGEDRFTYTVTDKDGDTSTATVTVEVVGSTQLPVQPPVQPPSGLQPEPRPETPAMPDRPAPTHPANPLQGDQVRDQSVFFDGALVTNLPRLSIPLHPIVYVTPQVNASQAERESTDPLFFSNPRAVQHGDVQSRTIGAGLGMDPVLFVQHAVRDSQARGALLGNIVDGRLPRLSLGSDGSIPTPQWFEPDPGQIVPEQPGERPQAAADAAPAPDTVPAQRADASPAGATPSTARPAAAPSFSEQLRNAGGRTPAVVARQAPSISSVS